MIQRRARSLKGAFKNLRLASRYRLRVLAPDDVVDEVPNGRRPACGPCEEKCCASPRSLVSLRLLDVARLVDAGLEHAIASSASEAAPSDETRAAIREVEHLDTWRRFPMIRKRPDGRCVLLDESGRCSAYEARPLQCRSFPFLVGDDLERVRWAGFCRSFDGDATGEERAAHLAAALASYHEKLKDLLALAHAPDAIEGLGLLERGAAMEADEASGTSRPGGERLARRPPARSGDDADPSTNP